MLRKGIRRNSEKEEIRDKSWVKCEVNGGYKEIEGNG
jgi:hypothetical protein